MKEIITESTRELISSVKEELSGERQNYLVELQKAVDYLNKEFKGSWWMIGGLAKDAYIGNSGFAARNEGRQKRDMDVLVENGDYKAFERLRKSNPAGIPMGGFLNRYVCVKESEAVLGLGSTKVVVPKDVFTSCETNLFGVHFPTLPPETLFHLYCLGGPMRRKDFVSAITLGRYIEQHPTLGLTEQMYRGFHDFARQSRKKEDLQVIMERLLKWCCGTSLGKKLPINSHFVRLIILHIWGAAGLIDRG